MSVYNSSFCLTEKEMLPNIILPFWQSQCLLTKPSKFHVKHMQLTSEIAISHTTPPCVDLISQPGPYFPQPGYTPLLKRQKNCHTGRFLRPSTLSIGTINDLHQKCRKKRFSMTPKSIILLNYLNSTCALQLHNPEEHHDCLTKGNFTPLPTF